MLSRVRAPISHGPGRGSATGVVSGLAVPVLAVKVATGARPGQSLPPLRSSQALPGL